MCKLWFGSESHEATLDNFVISEPSMHFAGMVGSATGDFIFCSYPYYFLCCFILCNHIIYVFANRIICGMVLFFQLPQVGTICHACFIILNEQSDGSRRSFGHNMICIGCGCSLVELRYHTLEMNSPLIEIFLSWNTEYQVTISPHFFFLFIIT